MSGKKEKTEERAALYKAAHDVLQPVFCRQLQADAITPRQLQRCASASGLVDGADSMNDMLPVTAEASQLGRN